MTNAWKQIHPKDSFVVKLAAPITNLDEKVLSYLYQPIIGIDAFSVYHMFLTSVDELDFISDLTLHSDLFSQMTIELPRLFQARTRLEGIGLLKVFVREQHNRRDFIYELQPPLNPVELFRDDILSLLLINSVGERRYQKLVAKFTIPEVDHHEFKDVTKNFIDVYQFNQESLTANQEIIDRTKASFMPTKRPNLSSVDESFDWKYFLSLLDGLYLDKEQVNRELKETVYTLHRLYGINELSMKRWVEAEVDYLTNQVNINGLKQSILLEYQGTKKQLNQESEEFFSDLTEDEKTLRRKNTLKLLGFSAGEVDVIISSETISPLIFLRAIKEQKGGFVASEERWAVENLVKQSGLPDSVINVLIHYVLVIKSNASFVQKFANTIANDWAQAQIFSPEDAMKKVKDMGIAQPKTTNYLGKTTNRNYQTGSIRKETLPDWVNQETKEETPVSQEEEQSFKERLRLMREKGKEGDS